MSDNKLDALKRYFGYDSFRPQQSQIIDTVMENRDCLGTDAHRRRKIRLFSDPGHPPRGIDGRHFSVDRIDERPGGSALRGNGVNAAFLNSTLSSAEQDQVMWQAKVGELKLLYIAPERLFSGNTFDFLREWNVCLFAIDEAHCISSWGHDFRPEYRQLTGLKVRFPDVPIIALTATADRVTRRDILKQLNIEHAETFIASFDRPNLNLSVLPGRKRLQQIQSFIAKHDGQAGIIYCLSRKGTETVAASLRNAGFKAEFYHAGLGG
jgi:ATP-dependent DNA helicase RecQ